MWNIFMQHLQRQTTSTANVMFRPHLQPALAPAFPQFSTFVDLCAQNVAHIFHIFLHFPTFVAPPGAVDPQMFPHLQQTSSTSEINRKCGAPGPQSTIMLY
jgi:hypothetical protein